MDGKKAIETLQKRYKRQNDYIKNSFDRVSITLPKGTKDRIKATGNSLNGLINELVLKYLGEYDNATQSHTEPPEDAQTVTQSATDPEELPHLDTLPEELPPLDWSQLPDDLNDMTPEQAEIIRRRCEARKAQETPPSRIPPEDLPFH